MCVDVGGSHFREREGVHRVVHKREGEGSQGVREKGGSRGFTKRGFT